MKFSRKEYWSGWPFPLPGDHLNSGIEPTSLCILHFRFFITEPLGKLYTTSFFKIYLSADGLLGRLHVLAIVNIASMNIRVQDLFDLELSLDICPGVGLLNHIVTLFLVL